MHHAEKESSISLLRALRDPTKFEYFILSLLCRSDGEEKLFSYGYFSPGQDDKDEKGKYWKQLFRAQREAGRSSVLVVLKVCFSRLRLRALQSHEYTIILY